MKYTDCKKLIENVYMKIGAYTTDARNISLMIIAHESGRGKHRRQLKADKPALGLCQMEYPTFNTVMLFSERIKQYLTRAGYNPEQVKFEQLETDDTLMLVFLRARLAMDPKALPVTPIAQADYCYRYWNAGGKASPDKYLNDWELWRNE